MVKWDMFLSFVEPLASTTPLMVLPGNHEYLLRGILMSTWGFLPAVFRPFRTVFPGLGAGFLNLGAKTEGTAKKRRKNGGKWARNGLKRVGVS